MYMSWGSAMLLGMALALGAWAAEAPEHHEVAPAAPSARVTSEAPSAASDPIPAWVVELAAAKEEARTRAAYRLKRAGPAAIAPLEKIAVSDSPLGRRAAEVLAFLTGPGADCGAWLSRVAEVSRAPDPDPKNLAEAAAPFEKLGGKAVGFLQEALRCEEDPALRQAARWLLLKHCRFTIGLSARWEASDEGTGCAVEGTTDLPDGTVLSCWVYAVFPGPGGPVPDEPRKRYVWGESTSVAKGMFAVRFLPELIAPGRYEVQAEVAPPQEGDALLLLDAGTPGKQWVGGRDRIASSIDLVLGDDEAVARERLTGHTRVRKVLESLSTAYGKLAARVVWAAGEPESLESEIKKESGGPLARIVAGFQSKDPVERAIARKALQGADPSLERGVWNGLSSGQGGSAGVLEAKRRAVEAIFTDWEGNVHWTSLEVAMGRIPGRDDEVMRTLIPYARSATAAERLGGNLLTLGRTLLEPVVGRKKENTPCAATLEGWLLEYHEAIRLYAEDRIENHLSFLEKLLRDAEEQAAACRGIPAAEARAAWDQAQKGWALEIDRLRAEWASEVSPPEGAGPFSKKAAAFLKERLGDFALHADACHAVLDAWKEAFGKGDSKEVEARAAALRETLQVSRASVQQGVITIGAVRVIPASREVELDAVVNMRQGLIELLASAPEGKLHEALLVVKGRPSDLYYALLRIGLAPGQAPNMVGSAKRPRGDLVDVWVEWRQKDGWRQIRAEDLLINMATGKPFGRRGWVFVGSEFMAEPDPTTGAPLTYFMANAFGSIATASAGYITSTVLDSTLRLGYGEVVADAKDLPPEGTPVRLRIRPISSAESAPIVKQMEKEMQEMEAKKQEAEQAGEEEAHEK